MPGNEASQNHRLKDPRNSRWLHRRQAQVPVGNNSSHPYIALSWSHVKCSAANNGLEYTVCTCTVLILTSFWQEHVEYVVERLNHEGRGIVEFLDYLTYVPLFVEIHDSIYGNPLDFTRTKWSQSTSHIVTPIIFCCVCVFVHLVMWHVQ